ncbi:hypothetical protein [Antarcticirhabdus aurantiaca]|uniref:Uncharacterized protein n=2 Tax=Antarcticirhabdus aurantiaca TaxID=2606717 RepID=A0ACD4NNL3_9HYPH|nr:hypothetical protein OXU80_26530 [Jeongeuplla avenae]
MKTPTTPDAVTPDTTTPEVRTPETTSSVSSTPKPAPPKLKLIARKSVTQIAKEDRQRTANWRADRRARRVPEASQIDRAVLEALMWRSRRGGEMMIDGPAFYEAMQVAVQLLIRRRADPLEAVAALQKRVGDHARSTAVRDMQRREKFDRENPLPDGEEPTR